METVDYEKLSTMRNTSRLPHVWRRAIFVATTWRTHAAFACLVVGSLLVGCTQNKRDATQFCRQLANERSGLSSPLATQGDVEQLVLRFERIGEVAPLEVSKDWEALTSMLREAAKAVTTDVKKLEEFAASAYAKNTAAQRALSYALTTCGVDISALG